MIGPKAYATLRLNISQTFYPIGAAAAGILLGKYLVFSEGESLEKQMAGMNAEQIHNFKVLMLENTLEPYKVHDYGTGCGDGVVPADPLPDLQSRANGES